MKEKQQYADFDNINAADLSDNAKLRALYLEAVRRGFWKNSTSGILEFWSLAEKALKEDKRGTPGRLFYALVKKKDFGNINDAMEIKAEGRLQGGFRHELLDEATEIKPVKRRDKPKQSRAEVSELLFGRNIGFHHGVMVQCFLPQQAFNGPIWQTDHGKASLMIEAGHIPDPTTKNRFVQKAVPSGTKARMIMPYIVGFAVQHNTPEIDMGDSMTRFLERLGWKKSGQRGREVTHQVESIAASTITLGFWDDDQVTGERLPIAREVSFWLERNDEQEAFWRPNMVLGRDFFEGLKEHRVPVDMDHLVKLARSARRQDLYVWFNYRLPKLRKPLMMPYGTMHSIFGQGIEDEYKFRQVLKGDLEQIRGVYDGFKLEPKKDYLLMLPSKSAVPHKVTRLIPKEG